MLGPLIVERATPCRSRIGSAYTHAYPVATEAPLKRTKNTRERGMRRISLVGKRSIKIRFAKENPYVNRA